MGKTSISVPEMGRLLGMKKVEAYWLVKQGRFTVVQVGGKMRIMLDSFEEWYGRQTRYNAVKAKALAALAGLSSQHREVFNGK